MENDRRDEMLELFDSMDAEGQLAALEAARKIKSEEIA